MSLGRIKGKCFTQKLLFIDEAESETVKGIAINLFDFYTELSVSQFNKTKWRKDWKTLGQLCETCFKDEISEVVVHSSPLTKLNRNENLLYHAFAVFKTVNVVGGQTAWWSVEKNGEHIVLQRTVNQDQRFVRDYLYTGDESQESMTTRNTPVKMLSESPGRGTLFDFLRALVDRHDLNERYHFFASNCQEFASFVFNTISGKKKKWNATVDGALMKILTRKKKYPSIFTDAFFGFYIDNRAIVEFHRDRWIAKLLRRRFIPVMLVRHRRRDNCVSVRVESADGRGANGAAGGKDFVAVNQVIDFKANEVEKQIIVEILPADSNNRHVIFFLIKLFLTGPTAGENHDVMIGYYSSQMIEVLLTDECNQNEIWTNFPLRKII